MTRKRRRARWHSATPQPAASTYPRVHFLKYPRAGPLVSVIGWDGAATVTVDPPSVPSPLILSLPPCVRACEEDRGTRCAGFQSVRQISVNSDIWRVGERLTTARQKERASGRGRETQAQRLTTNLAGACRSRNGREGGRERERERERERRRERERWTRKPLTLSPRCVHPPR